MLTYGHINISKMPNTNMRVWNIVLYSIKATIKHNINSEKRIDYKVRYNSGIDDLG